MMYVIDQTKTKFLLRRNEDFAVAMKNGPNDYLHENYDHLIEIPPETYCPRAPASVTRAPDSIPQEWHIKYPAVELFEPPWDAEWEVNNLKTRFLREAMTCEILKRCPHPNVATYHGCIVRDGLIRGICYAKYEHTLNEMVNPFDLSKKDFQYGKQSPLRSREACLAGIRAGVEHLHSMGLVHNDLKPDNIMLTSDETPVIIDFDSCASPGAPVEQIGRSLGWHDLEDLSVQPMNDLKAVDEIEKWLGDEMDKEYQFGTAESYSTGNDEAVEGADDEIEDEEESS